MDSEGGTVIVFRWALTRDKEHTRLQCVSTQRSLHPQITRETRNAKHMDLSFRRKRVKTCRLGVDVANDLGTLCYL